jgi:hypothetical protein
MHRSPAGSVVYLLFCLTSGNLLKMNSPSTLINPRLTDYFGITASQESTDFAIPFLDQDIPLSVDPFLLWKSPSQQDNSLHSTLLNGLNTLIRNASGGTSDAAAAQLVAASECNEIGLGNSASRNGRRIPLALAHEIIRSVQSVRPHHTDGISHIEELQLIVDGIGKDRICDFTCSFLKSFLIDFTMDQCERLQIPMADCKVDTVYDLRRRSFVDGVSAKLPFHPHTSAPILLAPKRWLRFNPWIAFDDYFKSACPQDDIAHQGVELSRVAVLNYNRENYGVVSAYIREKERTAENCQGDPLFKQVPVVNAKRLLNRLLKLPTGKTENADKKFEDAIVQLLASTCYPHLDFAADQVRTDSGTQIRDLIFYNTQDTPFLEELAAEYGSRQIVMEIKNVAEIGREHINQLNRYMAESLGRFGVLVTRNELKPAMRRNTIDLWAGQRRCIITLVDADVEQMVQLYESKQRNPLDVLLKKYTQFRRGCPS